jgi:hypothetical protein
MRQQVHQVYWTHWQSTWNMSYPHCCAYVAVYIALAELHHHRLLGRNSWQRVQVELFPCHRQTQVQQTREWGCTCASVLLLM